ncbi:MAG: hypothetical protein M1385_02765 [Candidatus Marsarchaeota archaeon]|nr:hypothetical protein [Candidatus Marsarchaeota archaeon]
MENKILYGYILLLIGIAILVFVFYIAYNMFTFLYALAQTPASPVSLGNVSATNLPSAIATNVVNSLPPKNLIYYIISIMLLFLFASIGFKFSELGIKLLHNTKIKRPV